jgi:hypothetical protein
MARNVIYRKIYPRDVSLSTVGKIISVPIGETWLMTLGWGAKSNMGVTNFNLRGRQFTKSGKIGLNQPLIYTDLFPPLPRKFFICPSLTQQPNKLLLSGKHTGFTHVYRCRPLSAAGNDKRE